MNVKIGIITVPDSEAQKVCDLLVESGILAIWNFAPTHIKAPEEILVQNELDAEVLTNNMEAAAVYNLKLLLKYAIIVVSTLPLFAFYPFVQRYFVKGVMIGSVKG